MLHLLGPDLVLLDTAWVDMLLSRQMEQFVATLFQLCMLKVEACMLLPVQME